MHAGAEPAEVKIICWQKGRALTQGSPPSREDASTRPPISHGGDPHCRASTSTEQGNCWPLAAQPISVHPPWRRHRYSFLARGKQRLQMNDDCRTAQSSPTAGRALIRGSGGPYQGIRTAAAPGLRRREGAVDELGFPLRAPHRAAEMVPRSARRLERDANGRRGVAFCETGPSRRSATADDMVCNRASGKSSATSTWPTVSGLLAQL